MLNFKVKSFSIIDESYDMILIKLIGDHNQVAYTIVEKVGYKIRCVMPAARTSLRRGGFNDLQVNFSEDGLEYACRSVKSKSYARDLFVKLSQDKYAEIYEKSMESCDE